MYPWVDGESRQDKTCITPCFKPISFRTPMMTFVLSLFLRFHRGNALADAAFAISLSQPTYMQCTVSHIYVQPAMVYKTWNIRRILVCKTSFLVVVKR